MITRTIRLVVPGTPAPKGSMRCIGGRGRGHQLIEDNKRTRPWRQNVARAASRAPEQADKGQPVEVSITFLLERPRSHYTARGALRKGSPALPTGHGTGDLDKLERTILDALEDAGVLHNDAQVIGGTTVKLYARPDQNPGATIEIGPL